MNYESIIRKDVFQNTCCHNNDYLLLIVFYTHIDFYSQAIDVCERYSLYRQSSNCKYQIGLNIPGSQRNVRCYKKDRYFEDGELL